eukprot:TRINITY_DN49000_c0_g1_i1.p1 TRINITY_DN49000_c0_g1~~TRINITY_DN49000_c0_g1_i1.p1  ORF type:complete len:610 (+),score=113.59 TRINITY_DN49000_c0_g1_i1:140-1831(+)
MLAALQVVVWCVAPSAGMYCEWHLDYFSKRVNYTSDPWRFNISPGCIELSCMTLLWGSLDNAGAIALASALEHAPQLEELTVGFNIISSEGIKALSLALRHVPRLRILHLGWNGVGDDGAHALAAGLAHVPDLTDLNLFWNGLGSSGVAAIAGALSSIPRLSVLSLSWNDVGNAGAIALAHALAKKDAPLLTELRLDWSNIGDAGAEALATSLRRQDRLATLRIKWNKFSDYGAMALAKAVVAVEASRIDAKDEGEMTSGVPPTSVATYGIPYGVMQAAREVSPDEGYVPNEIEPLSSMAEDHAEAAAQTVCQTHTLPIDALTCSGAGGRAACRALVVGNANYSEGALASAILDYASRAADSLERLGFNVSRVVDGTRKQMRKAFKAHHEQLVPGGVSLVLFSGVGLGSDVGDYLVPVDLAPLRSGKFKDEAIAVTDLMKAAAKRDVAVNLLIADTSRPPLGANDVEGIEGNAVSVFGRSLTSADLPHGALVAFGTSSSKGSDWSEASSFTAKFVRELEANQGLLIEQVLKRVRRSRLEANASQEVSWEVSSLTVDFVPNRGT